MSNQHNLRTKFIPFRPDTIVRTETPIKQTEHVSSHVSSNVSSHVSGHIYHNVYIDGGLMTQRVPVTVTSNYVCGSTLNFHITSIHLQ